MATSCPKNICVAILAFGLWHSATAQNKVNNEEPLFRVTKTIDNHTKIGFIDKTGRMVIEPKFEPIRVEESKYERDYIEMTESFHDGRCLVKYPDTIYIQNWDPGYMLDWRAGYIDRNGNVVIRDKSLPKHHMVGYTNFSDGLAITACTNNNKERFGYIDINGNVVIPAIFSDANPFEEGLALVQDTLGQWGYIDKTGKWKVPPQKVKLYELLRFPFQEGLALTMRRLPKHKEDVWGFITHDGSMVIKQSDDMDISYSEFSNGYAVARKKGKCGYINKKGEWVIQPQFYIAWPFREGLAAVVYNESSNEEMKWGFIDIKGHEAIPPLFSQVESFSEGKAWVGDRYIDKHGETTVDIAALRKLKSNYQNELKQYIIDSGHFDDNRIIDVYWEHGLKTEFCCGNFKYGLASFIIYMNESAIYKGYINTNGDIVYYDCLSDFREFGYSIINEIRENPPYEYFFESREQPNAEESNEEEELDDGIEEVEEIEEIEETIRL